jgi:hypothetical protein
VGTVTSLVLEKRPPSFDQVAEQQDCVADLVLAATPSAIPCARLLVDWVARAWQLDQPSVETARRAVDELVAHTVATTGISEPYPMHHEVFDWLTLLDVRLSLTPRALLVEVWDSGVEPPDARLAESPALLAASDSGYQLTRPGQRLVWCTVPACAADPERTLQLPRVQRRRVRQRSVGQPAALIRDPELLQQVLDGLRALDTTEETEC